LGDVKLRTDQLHALVICEDVEDVQIEGLDAPLRLTDVKHARVDRCTPVEIKHRR